MRLDQPHRRLSRRERHGNDEAVVAMTALVLAVGCAAGSRVPPTSPPSGARQPSGSGLVLVCTCDGIPAAFKPEGLQIACGDGNARATNLRWRSWGSPVPWPQGSGCRTTAGPSAPGARSSTIPSSSCSATNDLRPHPRVRARLVATFPGPARAAPAPCRAAHGGHRFRAA